MSLWDIFSKEEKQEEQTIKLVGSDLGYGQVKTFTDDTMIKFLSTVGTPISDFGRVAAVTTEKELLESLTVTFENQKYYVGHNAVVNSRNGRISLRQNKAESNDNKIKFLTSLALLTAENEEEATFDIVTGLPVLEYKNQKDKLYNMIYNYGQPFEFYMHYGPNVVKKKIKVNNIKVISQGEAAFYDFILDDTGNIKSERVEMVSGTVMVVDPGYRTTDIVTMENGRYIEPLSDQFNTGVNQIHQEILRLIMERLNIKKELKDLDEIVRSGKLFHAMKEYDIKRIIADATTPFAENIVENLHTISNDTLASMQRIILAGGGASIIYPYVKDLLKNDIEVSLMDNSEFCNASGYYKYGLLLKNQNCF